MNLILNTNLISFHLSSIELAPVATSFNQNFLSWSDTSRGKCEFVSQPFTLSLLVKFLYESGVKEKKKKVRHKTSYQSGGVTPRLFFPWTAQFRLSA